MKRKQGVPPSFEDLQRAKNQKTNKSSLEARGKKRSAAGDFAGPQSNKRRNNGQRNGGPVKEVFMSGALGVRSVVQDKLKVANGVRKGKKKDAAVKQLVQTQTLVEDMDDVENGDNVEEVNDANLAEADLEELSSDENMDDQEADEFGSSVFDSDEEDDVTKTTKAMFSEDEDESDAEEMLTAANIAGLSAKLDAEQEAEAEAARQELEESAIQTNLVSDIPKILPSKDEVGSDEDEDPTAAPMNALTLAPDLQLLRTRISDTIRVLEDFSKLAEAGRSRSEYRNQFLKDVCAYYTYSPYLAEKLMNLFPPREAFHFFEANESPRPVVIRTNTLKTHRRELAQTLIQRGVTLEPVGKWSKVGLQIFESPVPIGATPEYLAGHYILQAATSFLPVMALAAQEHERILDMASAPGGKVTHISALMKNTGVIFANDSNKARSKALIGNIHRLGAKNIIVCNYDARQFPKVMGGFDRVLLDAPCSGTGVIAKDPSVKTNKSSRDFLALPHLQKQLLLCAIDSVDHASATGGIIVYSTCSVTIEENEEVVQYALSKRPNIRIVDSGLGSFGVNAFTAFMGKSFDPNMKLAKRYYPHTYNVDGFFVCKLQKTGPSSQGAQQRKQRGEQITTTGTTTNGTNGTDETNGIEENTPSKQTINGSSHKITTINPKPDFGGWNSDEDQVYIERARKRAAKRKGKDPRTSSTTSSAATPIPKLNAEQINTIPNAIPNGTSKNS